MTDTPATIPCMSCSGKGTVQAFVDGINRKGLPFGGLERVSCFRCAGAGTVDARTPYWITRGDALRTLRQKSGKSLLDAVTTLGAGITVISQAENGRIDPEPFIIKAFAAGWRLLP